MSLRPSQHVGPYRIVGPLGRGGMGEVYRATDTRLYRDVALKVLPAGFATDSERLDRFQREARAAAALNHPNIFSVFDVGTDNGVPYFVSELLEGQTLRERVARGPLPVAQAVDFAAQIARGLAAAHDRGIVHRDLKPENLFITDDGRVKILDFGVARQEARADADAGNLATMVETAAGVLVGTIPYMSPEQVRGQPADSRSDLFALGTVLFEMLFGRPAFAKPTAAETFSAIVTGDPLADAAAPSPIPPALIEITRHCLEKDARQRFQTAHDVAFGLSVLSSPTSAAPRLPTAFPRRLSWAAAGIVLLLVGLGATVWWVRGSSASTTVAALPEGAKSIAALPFTVIGAAATDEYFTDGITDALITDLSKIEDLVVLARSAVFRYKGQSVDPQQIGRELGARYLLHGTVQRDGTTVRVNAQLVEATSGVSIWSERFDQDVQAVFALQDQISAKIVSALEVRLSPVASAVARTRPTASARAYEAYLQGMFYRHKPGQDALERAIPFLEQATAEDPQFALAHAALGSAYTQRFFYVDADRKWEQQAFLAIEKALRLDPNLAEAYLARGQLAWSLPNGFPHEQVAHDLKKAISINPGLADAHRELGKLYLHLGLLDKSIEANSMALRLDPTDRTAQGRLAGAYVYLRECATALERAHANDRRGRSAALSCLGRDEEALSLFATLENANDESMVALLLAKTGRTDAALRQIGRLKLEASNVANLSDLHHAQYNIGTAYALLGDVRAAIPWLIKATREGLPCYPCFERDPNLANVQKDPEFIALLAQLRTQWERFRQTL